jgi:hypothetical protein
MIRESDFALDTFKVGFGLSRDRTVAAIRRLADEVEAGETEVTGATVVGAAKPDEFTSVRLLLTLHSVRRKP